ALSHRRLRQGRRADAAGSRGRARDQEADAALHRGALAGGARADAAPCRELVLRRAGTGALRRLHPLESRCDARSRHPRGEADVPFLAALSFPVVRVAGRRSRAWFLGGIVSWLTMEPGDKRRRAKNLALLAVLVGLVVLLYIVTIVRLGMLP